jgi:hypothetical protein
MPATRSPLPKPAACVKRRRIRPEPPHSGPPAAVTHLLTRLLPTGYGCYRARAEGSGEKPFHRAAHIQFPVGPYKHGDHKV